MVSGSPPARPRAGCNTAQRGRTGEHHPPRRRRRSQDHVPGSSRSYGDAALNAGQLVVDNHGMTRVSTSTANAAPSKLEPGATIETMWRTGLPSRLLAARRAGHDVPDDGRLCRDEYSWENCFKAGPYGNHVRELDLLTASGELKTLSREQDPNSSAPRCGPRFLLGAVTREARHEEDRERPAKGAPDHDAEPERDVHRFVERMPQTITGRLDRLLCRGSSLAVAGPSSELPVRGGRPAGRACWITTNKCCRRPSWAFRARSSGAS